MENKQTALEWYEKEISSLIKKYQAQEISQRDFIVMKNNLFHPAKAMEEEQMELERTEAKKLTYITISDIFFYGI